MIAAKAKFSPPVADHVGPALTALENKRYPFFPPNTFLFLWKGPATVPCA